MGIKQDSLDALAELELRISELPSQTTEFRLGLNSKAMKVVVDKTVDPIIDKIAEINSRLKVQEKNSLINGKDGKQGKDGKDGRQGVDGRQGINGRDGKIGTNGRDGKDGTNGVSVVDSEIAADGHLVLNLSNGNIIDAGNIVNSKSGGEMYSITHAKPQIVVSLTAPPNPQPNDLWYDLN